MESRGDIDLSALAIIISIASLGFAMVSFYKSHRVAKRQLEIEESRRSDERSAFLTCQFHNDGKRRVLRIANKGNGQARNIKLLLDGIAAAEHPCWVSGQNEISIISGQNYADYLLSLTMRSPIPKEAEIHWEDDVKNDNVNKGVLTL